MADDVFIRSNFKPYFSHSELTLVEDTTRGNADTVLETAGLVALLELRELIASELDQGEQPETGQRSFRPLTDGLGLESPKRKEAPVVVPPPTRPLPDAKPVVSLNDSLKPRLEPTFAVSEVSRSQSPLAAFMDRAEKEAELAEERAELSPIDRAAKNVLGDIESPIPQPPPMPGTSIFRRTFSAMLDEIFVLSLVLIAVGVTMKLLTASSVEFSLSNLKALQTPAFFRFAILEFGTIWLSYLALCVGLLDMTFGMWVWGIRIAYGNEQARFFKKMLRVFFGFAFYAPVFPLLLLVFQRRGRNLLDLLSGTALYRTV